MSDTVPAPKGYQDYITLFHSQLTGLPPQSDVQAFARKHIAKLREMEADGYRDPTPEEWADLNAAMAQEMQKLHQVDQC